MFGPSQALKGDISSRSLFNVHLRQIEWRFECPFVFSAAPTKKYVTLFEADFFRHRTLFDPFDHYSRPEIRRCSRGLPKTILSKKKDEKRNKKTKMAPAHGNPLRNR